MRVLKASSLSQKERKMYSFLEVMMAIAFGMKRAVFSLVMHRMWLKGGGGGGGGAAQGGGCREKGWDGEGRDGCQGYTRQGASR